MTGNDGVGALPEDVRAAVRTDDPDDVLAGMEAAAAVTAVEPIRRDPDAVVVQFETTQPLLLPAEASGVPISLPAEIADGRAALAATASRDRITALGDPGLRYSLDRLYGSVEAASPLTDRQREMLLAALERGYQDTPRTTTLSGLADDLGMAASTTSETIHRAEAFVADRLDTGPDVHPPSARGARVEGARPQGGRDPQCCGATSTHPPTVGSGTCGRPRPATCQLMSTSSLDSESVVIVGAGFGGLSAACHLADAGADVTVVEQRAEPGGVAGRIERGGFRFDTGPSWYLMPSTFERFFARFDRAPSDYYGLTRLDPNYQVYWKDGDTAALPADRAGQRELFESYEAGAADALEDYLADAREAYEVGMEEFVYERRPRWRDWLDPDLLRAARGVTLLGSMDDQVGRFFDHPKLRQLVEYTLVFLGGSPYNTPALYSLMSHVDMNEGVYYPTGGVAAVVDGIADLARELGVEFRFGHAVTAIERLPDGLLVSTAGEGPDFEPDRVVCNATPAHAERELLPADARDRDPADWDDCTYAPSAFMCYLGVEGALPELEHHTLVLPTDWDDHFAAIFDEPAWPEDPSYYVNVPSRTDDAVAPPGHETVVVLVPIAPGLDDGPEARDRYREQVLDDLARHAGVDLRDRIVVEASACVSEFAALGYPEGTALGLAHTLTQTGPLRPDHRSAAMDGLYYAGSFTEPGIGMPMCLISGEHAAAAVAADATTAASGPLARVGLRSD